MIDPQVYVPMLLMLARRSPCSRDNRGAIVLAENGDILGRGWNSPIGDTCSELVCRSGVPSMSCAGRVEHAEAAALRVAERALWRQALISRPYRRAVLASQDWLACFPLTGCTLVHLNTELVAGDETRRSAKPSRRRGCPSCAVQMHARGIGAVWLLHDDGWTRYTMDEYARMAGVIA